MTTDPRKLLDTYASEDARPLNPYLPDREDCAEKAFAALRAVLDLHQPETFDWVDADSEDRTSTDCKECDSGGVSDNWPCPTVLAITAALAAACPRTWSRPLLRRSLTPNIRV